MKSGIEIERKYVIKIPKLDFLRTLDGYTESDIVQVYLPSVGQNTSRIRKRTADGVSVYTKTEKRRIDEMSALETESEIDAAHFAELMKNPRRGSAPIIKKRVTFIYDSGLFEVDIYPNWQRSCIMEIELSDKDASFSFPPFIELVREVTGEKAYSNSSMSMSFPKELI